MIDGPASTKDVLLTHVAIVVPTLGKRLEWLRQTLDSIRGQQVSARIEIILVTPSPDTVLEIAELAGARVIHSDRPGISAAINDGWATCLTADYLAWLGDDDVLAPGSLSASISALTQFPDASATYGMCRYVDENDRTLFIMRPGQIASAYLPWGKDLVPQPGSVFRRNAIEGIGSLDEELRYAMDYDLFLKLRQFGRLHYIPRELAAFRLHSGSVTGSNRSGAEAEMVRSRTHSAATNRVRRTLRFVTDLSDRVLYRTLRSRGSGQGEFPYDATNS